jgi:multidrug efflux pump subunit AcrA (membrane-fusion protein)
MTIGTGAEPDRPDSFRCFDSARSFGRRSSDRGRGRAACAIGLPLVVTALLLAGCQRETEASAPEIRPVRTVTVAKRDVGEIVSYTGRIEVEIETRLSFRIGGRMIERSVHVGDRVEPGQVVAKLDAQNELNALRSAQAAQLGN